MKAHAVKLLFVEYGLECQVNAGTHMHRQRGCLAGNFSITWSRRLAQARARDMSHDAAGMQTLPMQSGVGWLPSTVERNLRDIGMIKEKGRAV